jgi:branched-chain amino acid transport system permease protein
MALVIMMIFRPQGIIPPKPHRYPVDALNQNEVSL